MCQRVTCISWFTRFFTIFHRNVETNKYIISKFLSCVMFRVRVVLQSSWHFSTPKSWHFLRIRPLNDNTTCPMLLDKLELWDGCHRPFLQNIGKSLTTMYQKIIRSFHTPKILIKLIFVEVVLLINIKGSFLSQTSQLNPKSNLRSLLGSTRMFWKW